MNSIANTFGILNIFLETIVDHMSAIIILLFASISIAALFLAAFIWSVKSGQYDDEKSPPMRILFDDNELPKS